MLTVISPAKKMDMTPVEVAGTTEPAFAEDAAQLADVARGLDVTGLKKLMGISDDLARLNRDRFAEFGEQPRKPAALAFAGDTYRGLEAGTLDADALRWAQGHLRILSGLYGLLRPLDLIEPYRLEMGSRLGTERGRTLYDWWGARLGHALKDTARDVGAAALVNCASQEYFGAVDTDALGLPVITPVFLEDREGGPKVVSFYAKQARGAMARFIVENRLTDPEALAEFDSGGYAFAPELSKPGQPAFLRGAEAQARKRSA
ncbi:peroxide stress protein YaaA [Rhodosalinus sp. 5P4]|uniref:peroxide stress protein YaaA n=1 Tax=Rhodosalinus sp. 5P4 TaxID=3239196 RepID=UPI0035264180